MFRCLRSVVIFGVLASMTSGLLATIAPQFTTKDLVTRADAIVIGRCTGVEGRWMAQDLVTLAQISVSATLKGEEHSSVTVVLPGGIDPKSSVPIAREVIGAPTISTNEDVFLFLRKIEGLPNNFTILGFSQGKFSIKKDKEGRKSVRQNLSNIGLQSQRGIAPGPVTEASFKNFHNMVRDLLTAEKRNEGGTETNQRAKTELQN